MVERIVLSPPPGSALVSPEVRPTGRINLNPRQEQVIQAREEERARQAQLDNLASRYNNRFNPQLVADIAAQQELGRNSTAAADYITQIGMERRKEEIQRGLLGADQPNGLAGKATDVGAGIAQDRNTVNSLSGLLGDIDYRGILNRLVKTFQRPEMLTPGVNALTAFGMSGAALNQAEMAGAAAEQERMDKLEMEKIKKSGPAPLTATVDKRLTSFRSNSEALNTINRYLTILTSGQTGGIAGKMEKGIDDLASLVGLGSGSQASKAEAARSLLLSTIRSLKQTEGQISRYDYEEIENYLKKPNSWWINNEKIANQLRNLKPVIQRTLSQDAMIIRESGRDPSQFSGYNNIRLSTPGRTVTE